MDRPCSIFIDPKSGAILIDEGEGDDRLNGMVMHPDRAPKFSVTDGPDGGAALHLVYAGFRLVVGRVTDAAEATAWASSTNEFLLSKRGSAL